MAKTTITYKNTNLDISYLLEKTDNSNKKNIYVLHGWGANKELMYNAFNNILKSHYANIIYLDLTGFGQSQEPSFALNTSDYLDILKLIEDKLGFQIHALLGHSYGAKLSALYASKFYINELILCASAGIVLPKSLKVRFKIKLAKLLNKCGLNYRKYLASKDGASLSNVMYETFKNVVDEDFTNVFANIKTKTLLLWGKDDTATPLKAANIIHNLIICSKLEVFNGDHFFFLKNDLEPSISAFLSKN